MDVILDSKVSISNENFDYLLNILPDDYDTNIINYKVITANTFECSIRNSITNKLLALEWLKSFESKSLTSWRAFKVYPENTTRIVFKKVYRCHHNTKPKKTAVPHEKHTNCPAQLTITVKQQDQKRSADKELANRPCEITLRFTHNHNLTSAAALKFRKPGTDIVNQFHDLFNKGHSPSSAWQSYRFELQGKYGNEYYKVAADGAVWPTRKWVYDLYYSLFKKEYGDSTGDGMVLSLEKAVQEYNSSCDSVCAVLKANEKGLILAICDPLMKRVHESLSTSGETIFVDSSGNMDRHNSRLFSFLCASIAGALPLGIVITFSECEDVLTEAFLLLKTLFPERCFYGLENPRIIITDDCTTERNALQKSFPTSLLLLCKFHVLQAAMRYLWDAKHGISKTDRQELYFLFQKLVYIKDKNAFECLYREIVDNPLLQNYPFAKKYFAKMYERASDWALCYRTALINRGHDTNNYSEANFRVIKDLILKRTKAFSVVQLFNFIVAQLMDYYKRSITDILNNRKEGYCQSRYFVSDQKIQNLIYDKIDDITYSVKNTENSNENLVNIENFICSCSVGINGAPCKHQFAVVKGENLSSVNFIVKADKELKLIFHKILTGRLDIEKKKASAAPHSLTFCVQQNISLGQ